MDYISQIKNRILISEIVRERVKLQKHGSNFMACCPFHNEKTASFTVNNNRQTYHCFGCGAHGDIFDFTMKFEGLTFNEALENLAKKAGIVIKKQQRVVHYQYDILKTAVNWFKNNLHRYPQALQCLQSRCINKESIKTFEIGYSPITGVNSFLKKQGFSELQISEAGLISKNYKEYFYDRIILPIHNNNGQIIALGGRSLKNNHPKYLNSPETTIFKKSETIYALHLARSENTENIIVVEGYLDVIALHQEGIKNTVAPLGTALTPFHLQKLYKMYKEIIICFDGDNAGRNATLKTIRLALADNLTYQISFILLENNNDPCDIISQNGVIAFHKLLKSRKSISEALWEILSIDTDFSKPEKKARLRENIFQYIKIIKNKEIQQYYRSFFAKKINRTDIQPNSNNHLLPSINFTNGTMLIKIVFSYPEILQDPKKEEIFAQFIMENNTLILIQDFVITTINEDNLDKLCDTSFQGKFSKKIQEILNNSYTITNKEHALAVWDKIMLTEEIKYLEKEYSYEVSQALKNNLSENKANNILQQLIKLKSSLHKNLND